jgi:spoIIIJ-associated protein
MQNAERSAKSADEAIELALADLGVGRDQVMIEVLSEGRSGILGIGAEEARVRVSLRDDNILDIPQDELTSSSKEVLETILKALGLPTTVNIKSPSAYGMTDGQVSCVLDIQGEDLGILIGRRGKTLFSLQYLVNLILSKRLRSRVKVFVDVEGYRLRRQASLKALALRMADQVQATRRGVTLEAMPPHERRIVHLTLQDNRHVVTESIGEGDNRKVNITLRN